MRSFVDKTNRDTEIPLLLHIDCNFASSFASQSSMYIISEIAIFIWLSFSNSFISLRSVFLIFSTEFGLFTPSMCVISSAMQDNTCWLSSWFWLDMIHHNHPCGSQIGSYFYWVDQLYNCIRRIFDHWIANNQFSIFKLFFFVDFTWNPSSIIDLWVKVVFGSLCLSYTFAIIGFRMLVYCCLKAFKSKKLGVLIYYSFCFFFVL